MIAFGIISEVFRDKGTARVQFADLDNMVSQPLPMMVQRSHTDKFSLPFDINEHVVCLMDEDFENGVILGAIYSTNELPPATDEGDVKVSFVHGLSMEYKRSTKTLSVKGTGKVDIDITGDVNVKSTNAKVEATTKIDVKAPLIAMDAANITMSGALTVVGVVTAGGIAAAAGSGGSGNVSIAGNVTVTGDITANEVTAGLIPLKTHKHPVTAAPGTSGTPIP